MLEIAVEAARAAGAIQREKYGHRIEVRHKGLVDLVAEVDVACEEAIRAVLARRAPGVAMLGEEQGGVEHAEELWIFDPLDGTTNFAHGVPCFCASVALERRGRVVAGAIYEPMRDELFTAEAVMKPVAIPEWQPQDSEPVSDSRQRHKDKAENGAQEKAG